MNVQKPTEYDAMTSTPEVLVLATKKAWIWFVFQKINISIFFTVTHHNISQLTQKYNKHNKRRFGKQ